MYILYVAYVSVSSTSVKLLLCYLQVNVIVEDENDNAPVFERSSYEGHIAENSPGGTKVMLDYPIRATDADVGHHAQFTFTLHGDGSELFTVEQASGQVFFKGSHLDREEKALYLLRIVARDKGKPVHNHVHSYFSEWLCGFGRNFRKYISCSNEISTLLWAEKHFYMLCIPCYFNTKECSNMTFLCDPK